MEREVYCEGRIELLGRLLVMLSHLKFVYLSLCIEDLPQKCLRPVEAGQR